MECCRVALADRALIRIEWAAAGVLVLVHAYAITANYTDSDTTAVAVGDVDVNLVGSYV